MKGLFVTATGTEIGKTVLACGIARFLNLRGIGPGVMKPVASGGRWRKIDGKRQLVSRDALDLKTAARSQENLRLVNPVCFENPLAPYSASQIEKRSISVPQILSAYEWICRHHIFSVVEGVGGVCVPVTEKFDVSDLILEMRLPAIVVASAKLGTLNHTLLTLNYLERKKIEVLGIVLNFFSANALVDKTNLKFFRRRGIPVLLTLERNAKFSRNPDLVAGKIDRSPLAIWLERNVL